MRFFSIKSFNYRGKVIFLHLFVILFTRGGGVVCLVWGGGGIPQGTEADPPDPAHHSPPGPGTPPPPPGPGTPPSPSAPDPPPEQTPPPTGKQTPAHGLRAAGTHPTGRHSCYNYDCSDDIHTVKLPGFSAVTLYKFLGLCDKSMNTVLI